MVTNTTIRWLSVRVRLACLGFLLVASVLPPYVPDAALASPELAVATPQFLLVEDGFIMKSSSLTRQGSRRAYAEGIIHTVKEGESLERLANRYGISADTIRWANNLKEQAAIQPGDELLVLPVDGVLHTVKRNQNLTQIAELYGVPAEEIAAQNKVQGGFLLAGQELIIPGGTPITGTPTIVASAEPPPQQPSTPEQPTTAKPQPTQAPPAAEEPATYTDAPTSGVLQKPCSSECFITQYYHPGHYAIDMQERGGGPIFAAEAGTVIRADYGWNGGFGNVIEIDHGNDLVTLYGHNKELYVKVGDAVERGQKISWMGNTGLVYGKTGIHVHFEVRLQGVKKNPLLYIQ
jgi:murein DD-endopeptidase MepM/ murein hydrolase activator NlpD